MIVSGFRKTRTQRENTGRRFYLLKEKIPVDDVSINESINQSDVSKPLTKLIRYVLNSDINQKRVPLRAMKIFIRKKMGHTK